MKSNRLRVVCLLLLCCGWGLVQQAQAHGGGCRKASLPKCCHMDRSTGEVHCH